MALTALVCFGVTSFVNLGAEVFPKHLILYDRANCTNGYWLEVDVVSGRMLFDGVDASGYAALKQPAIVFAF